MWAQLILSYDQAYKGLSYRNMDSLAAEILLPFAKRRPEREVSFKVYCN